jgi:tRNA modification GTPase
LNNTTTIFAPATPVGESSITVIRISGKDSFAAASALFSKSKYNPVKVDFDKEASHTAHHGYIIDNNEIMDEAVIIVFKNPHSYTGEDVVEISIHGGIYNFRKINNLLSKLGCVHAVPGEFSKRAYLNGKVDLAQAEAISDLIRAKTEMASKAALKQLKGELSVTINKLRDEMINYCSLVELELDFSEEGLEVVAKDTLLAKIEDIIRRIQELTNSYSSGRIIRDGVNLAIIGKPNAGKSTIFNHLLNDSRAIVSDIPGTTRDYLQEPLILGGMMFNLIDTAGLRETTDHIEMEGVKRSHKKIEEADLVLNVVDLSSEKISDVKTDLDKMLTVYNKSDIARELPEEGLCVSAKKGDNMKKLEAEIITRARNLIKDESGSEIYITNERHRDCLLKSCEYLVNARKLASDGAGNELISFEIREAMNGLSEIIGKTTNVDILNNIFAKFCIGK